MAFLSYDLIQSWSSSSEQVLTVPENPLKEGSKRHLPLLSQSDMPLKRKETCFPGNCYQSNRDSIGRTQFTRHLLLLNTYCVPRTMYLHGHPGVLLHLRQSTLPFFPKFNSPFTHSSNATYLSFTALNQGWILHYSC
jgi:hypothetical protein